MHTKTNIKENIVTHLQKLLDDKMLFIKEAIESVKEARDNESKSSVGDKYETNRAMMQIELEKNQKQLAQNQKIKKEISELNCSKEYNKVEPGSLVLTNQGNYFISVGIGKIEIDQEVIYAISPASPIGQILIGRIIGDIIQFQAKDIIISDII